MRSCVWYSSGDAPSCRRNSALSCEGLSPTIAGEHVGRGAAGGRRTQVLDGALDRARAPARGCVGRSPRRGRGRATRHRRLGRTRSRSCPASSASMTWETRLAIGAASRRCVTGPPAAACPASTRSTASAPVTWSHHSVHGSASEAPYACGRLAGSSTASPRSTTNEPSGVRHHPEPPVHTSRTLSAAPLARDRPCRDACGKNPASVTNSLPLTGSVSARSTAGRGTTSMRWPAKPSWTKSPVGVGASSMSLSGSCIGSTMSTADMFMSCSAKSPGSCSRTHPPRCPTDPCAHGVPAYPSTRTSPAPRTATPRTSTSASTRARRAPCTRCRSSRASPGRRRRALWDAVHLENEYVRLMILPELGGRIHVGLDKTRGYDFFYRNDVIKPALVGLAGPWISGGVEFNWPQHHRPATYLPCEVTIEEEPDGSVTVWCSDHDPFARMQGMHGIRLRPGSALIEVRGHLVNRTDDVQTFLWWANVAAAVNDDYQSYFPTDVHVVADHAKRAITTFPASRGHYYGVDYPARRDAGAAGRRPARLVPEHPRADVVHVPRDPGRLLRRLRPRRRGRVRALGGSPDRPRARSSGPGATTSSAGPGTRSSPTPTGRTSSSWPASSPTTSPTSPSSSRARPGRSASSGTRSRTPARSTRPPARPRCGSTSPWSRAARRFARPSRSRRHARAAGSSCVRGRRRVLDERVDIEPGAPFVHELTVDGAISATECELVVEHDGEPARDVEPPPRRGGPAPAQEATEPPEPSQIDSVDELYLTGVHLAQYRHATRSPEPYWDEALRRDPGDSRSHVALAARRQHDGRLDDAERHLRAAVDRITRRNPNPRDCEAHYRLGVVLARQGRAADARRAFGVAMWDRTWLDAATVASARLDLAEGRDRQALDRPAPPGPAEPAARAGAQPRGRRDPSDGRHGRRPRAAPRNARDQPPGRVGARPGGPTGRGDHDHAGPDDRPRRRAGVPQHRRSTTRRSMRSNAPRACRSRPVRPTSHRSRCCTAPTSSCGGATGRQPSRPCPGRASWTARWCFPSAHDNDVLARLRGALPDDDMLAELQGHWLYAAGRRDEAIRAWEVAAAHEPASPVVLRNLGIAAHNVLAEPALAASFYERARLLAPDDARLLFEADQLAGRRGVDPAQRIATLLERPRPRARARRPLGAARRAVHGRGSRTRGTGGAPRPSVPAVGGRRGPRPGGLGGGAPQRGTPQPGRRRRRHCRRARDRRASSRRHPRRGQARAGQHRRPAPRPRRRPRRGR